MKMTNNQKITNNQQIINNQKMTQIVALLENRRTYEVSTKRQILKVFDIAP